MMLAIEKAALPKVDSVAVVPKLAISATELEHLQRLYAKDLSQLLLQFTPEMLDITLKTPLADRRFSDVAWQNSPLHRMTVALYLLQARYLESMTDIVVADKKTQDRIRFLTTQWVAALSPANFFSTNPEAQNAVIETCGESLRLGMFNLLSDLAKGRVSQTDESTFEVGKNIANTSGSVIFENEFFQLLHYAPLTATVYSRPLLFVPPCINKYYVLDLQPENSLVRYAISQGHTVFLISWRNPDASMIYASWDDYIEQAVIRAIEIVCAVSGQQKINILGFCIGGTLVSTALAVLAARGLHVAESLTLLTTLLDFSDAGVLGALVDENQVFFRETSLAGMHGGGYGLMRATELANLFSFLRPDDLVWPYVVENYLKGHQPPPFDLLYWSGDGTNLPGPMFAWYLRHLYLQNELRQAGKLTICNQHIDLSQVATHLFAYASREDHIVPWTCAYISAGLLGKSQTFVLGAAGHIGGVVNPPGRKKRRYWVSRQHTDSLPQDHTIWLRDAKEMQDSWWCEWIDWLLPHAGDRSPAKAVLGNKDYPPIEPAPGRYVLQKAYFNKRDKT